MKSNQFINALHLKDKDVVIVKEKEVDIDDKNEVISTKNKFRYFKNPKRTVYITKPEYRTHKYKKTDEDINKCDKYLIPDIELVDTVKRLLDIPAYKRMYNSQLFSNPYIYNADIDMEVLVRDKYKDNQKHNNTPLTVGALDIETSVLGDERIILISFAHGTKMYCGILDDCLYQDGKKKTLEDVYSYIDLKLNHLADPKIKKYLDKYPFTYECKVFEFELDLIKWIFKVIHQSETDFIGIWNMAFDIPYILKRLELYDVDIDSILSHPDIEENYRYHLYKEDRSKTAHIVEKWHYFFNTSMSQFIDYMALYARIRKTDGKEPKYSLEFIANKELGFGKLPFDEGLDHFQMQKNKFLDYVVYNIFDSMLIQFMEFKNKDFSTMYLLTGSSPYKSFSKQTIILRDKFYKFCLEHGRVFATCGLESAMVGEFDNLITASGGTVCPAEKVKGVGVNCIEEVPDVESKIVPLCSDIDFKAEYPSIKMALGISKESKYNTLVEIENISNKKIEELYIGLINSDINSIFVCNEFLGLPDFDKINELFLEHIQQE